MPLDPSTPYVFEQSVWTAEDFSRMRWHDVYVHAFLFDPETCEFILDIDYRFAWVNPVQRGSGYTFWVAPCTLVFHDVREFRARLPFDNSEFLIYGIQRSQEFSSTRSSEFPPSAGSFTWTIDFDDGDAQITFEASGFTQYTRARPTHMQAECFSREERNGISFDRPETAGPPIG